MLDDLKPQKDDLLVVPYDMVLPEGLTCLVHRIKHLLTPSIIRSEFGFGGGKGVKGFFECLSVVEMMKQLLIEATPKKVSESQEKVDLMIYPSPDVGLEIRVVPRITSLEPRYQDLDFGPMDWSGVREESEPESFFRHVRGKKMSPKGGVTFFIELHPADNERYFNFSYSLCSYEDNFNRKVGRNIAAHRMKHGDWYEVINYNHTLGITQNIRLAIQKHLQVLEEDGIMVTPSFSSMSNRTNDYELALISQRIETHEYYNQGTD